MSGDLWHRDDWRCGLHAIHSEVDNGESACRKALWVKSALFGILGISLDLSHQALALITTRIVVVNLVSE